MTYNKELLLSYSKNYICKFVQDNSWHHKYSTSNCPFVSEESRKDGKKLQKFEYLENEKRFLDEIKNAFHGFEGLSFGGKIKIR